SQIPSRNEQTMQPNPPADVSSSALPQTGQFEISCAGGCICLAKLRPPRDTSAAVPRLPLRVPRACRGLLLVESSYNASSIALNLCEKLFPVDAIVALSLRTGLSIVRWP